MYIVAVTRINILKKLELIKHHTHVCIHASKKACLLVGCFIYLFFNFSTSFYLLLDEFYDIFSFLYNTKEEKLPMPNQ